MGGGESGGVGAGWSGVPADDSRRFSTLLGVLFGLAGMGSSSAAVALPLPVRLDIVYGAPLRFEGDGTESDATVTGWVNQVKATVAQLIEQ